MYIAITHGSVIFEGVWKNWPHEMHVLNVKARNTFHFDRARIHLVQAIMTKWGMKTIIWPFLVPKWGIQFIFALKNDRTVSIILENNEGDDTPDIPVLAF